MRWLLVIIAVLLLIVGYAYVSTANGSITPEGRLALVKLANPDMYPGHLHSKLLAQQARDMGSKTALVVHFGGSSNYRSYMEGDIFIIELAFIDTQGTGATGPPNYLDSLKIALFGAPDGRYKYKGDGMTFNSYDDAMNHVYKLAQEHGQQGPIPMVWHGTARSGTPLIAQGCGFPLYFDILRRQYGIIPAYVYTFVGMFSPYLKDPYANFELAHSNELQNYYKQGMINFQ